MGDSCHSERAYTDLLIVKPHFNEDAYNILIGRAISTYLMQHSQTCSKIILKLAKLISGHKKYNNMYFTE